MISKSWLARTRQRSKTHFFLRYKDHRLAISSPSLDTPVGYKHLLRLVYSNQSWRCHFIGSSRQNPTNNQHHAASTDCLSWTSLPSFETDIKFDEIQRRKQQETVATITVVGWRVFTLAVIFGISKKTNPNFDGLHRSSISWYLSFQDVSGWKLDTIPPETPKKWKSNKCSM